MFEDIIKYEENFNYVDSSEEEDNFYNVKQEAQKNKGYNLTISY